MIARHFHKMQELARIQSPAFMQNLNLGEIGAVPSRTAVTLTIPKDTMAAFARQVQGSDDVVLDTAKIPRLYRCIDCNFITRDVNVIFEHQRNPNHTVWQRIRKFFGGSGKPY